MLRNSRSVGQIQNCLWDWGIISPLSTHSCSVRTGWQKEATSKINWDDRIAWHGAHQEHARTRSSLTPYFIPASIHNNRRPRQSSHGGSKTRIEPWCKYWRPTKANKTGEWIGNDVPPREPWELQCTLWCDLQSIEYKQMDNDTVMDRHNMD